MNIKTLAFLTIWVLAFSACTTVVETESMTDTRDSEGEEMMEMEGEAMEEEVSESDGVVLVDFNQADYDAALASGNDVFLEFYASWCPTCIANAPELEAALEGVTNDNLVAFRVDYDNSAELQKQFDVLSQSTYILIAGGDLDSYDTLGPGLFKASNFSGFLE